MREPNENAPGHWVEVRPGSELAQGQYAWPAWGLTSVGVATALFGVGILLVRWRRARSSR